VEGAEEEMRIRRWEGRGCWNKMRKRKEEEEKWEKRIGKEEEDRTEDKEEEYSINRR
jgi:hypothetical protein